MNNLKPHSIIIFILFLSGIIISWRAEGFRFSPSYRWIYDIGIIFKLLIIPSALLYSFIVLIFYIKKDINLKIKYKWGWLALALSPILYFATVITFEFIKNHTSF
ncbi:hypothetical protein [Flavobacterium foetidum]|uniref:hypothetical protein n=1 Tax=Flavobacterium foetidum TaxID=2026681 RepID=UPI0010752508|nr:hypothetical protein [Flavobacterium foetidum]KAF2515287.1 hypothetical protein E0W73_10145 [Flavobacterium foetidum]